MVTNPAKNRLRTPIVSLFSGPGGLDLGFRDAGFETLFAADFSRTAVETYNHNLPPVAHELDLSKTSPQQIVELIRECGVAPRGVVGGPPCQSFSQANVRQRHNDPRRKLIFRFAEMVAAIDAAFNIDFFLMENVSALAKPKHRKVLDKLKREFRTAGFVVHEAVKNAHDYGIAQRRRRLFLVGIKSDLARFSAFEFPEGSPGSKTVRTEIAHLPEPLFFDRANALRRASYHPNHWTMMPRSSKFANASSASGRSFRKLSWDLESPAVAYGHREIHVHPSGTRRLSILEALLLQGFPRKFELLGNLSDQVTQVSNAVPPPLAKAIAESIREALYGRRAGVQRSILAYATSRGRDFPWRRTSDVFHLLVAEKLLQQTAARPVVVTAYNELVQRWPSPARLARAPLAAVRKIIQPLGLTYRAEELIALASTIVARHGGLVPLKRSALMRLPGVGEYAADAVLSFSQTENAAVVDTNVSRLLHRFLGLQGDQPLNPARSPKLKRLATWFSASQDSRQMNYAILDFTAAVCIARSPECSVCPISQYCVLRTTTGSNVAHRTRGAILAKDKR